MKKKLMLLGGIRYLVPVITKAQKLGIRVLTADYLPDNVAHRHSDEYANVSIVDKEAVLAAARASQIDGILSYACDPGVVSAAYVAERLGLPFACSYRAACILQDKGLFRQFLREHGFNCPRARRYESVDLAIRELSADDPSDPNLPRFPVFVKPVDSAGSKGCSRAETLGELEAALTLAKANSRCGAIIVEDFLKFEGRHSGMEVFAVDGRVMPPVVFESAFDPNAANPNTPAFCIMPSAMAEDKKTKLFADVQRLMILLQVGTGLFDVEVCVANGGVPYIMEVSPRGGGCKVSELVEYATGQHLLENDIRHAVGLPLVEFGKSETDGFWSIAMLHAPSGCRGRFERLVIEPKFQRQHVRLLDLGVSKGDLVYPYTGANRSLGDMFMRFDSRAELEAAIADSSAWLKVEVTPEQTDGRTP